MKGILIPWHYTTHYGDARGVHYVRWWQWLGRGLVVRDRIVATGHLLDVDEVTPIVGSFSEPMTTYTESRYLQS